MNDKIKKRLFNLSKTIKNSEKKIEKYKSELNIETKYKEKQELELKIEIEKLRIEMKIREGKLIMLNDELV